MDYDPNFWERLFWLIKYPDSISLANILHEIIVFILTVLVLYHSYKKYGLLKSILFFSGGFLFSGVEENEMIITGYKLKGQIILGTEVPMTYHFNYHAYILWFLAVPIIVCCAWYIITYTSVQITLYVTKGHIKSSLLGAYIGVSIDFMIDPIMIRRMNWIWLAEKYQAFWFLQVPVSNYIGWFVLIFGFNWIFYWYHDTFLKRKNRENWATWKKVLLFYGFMYATLILTEIITVGLTILLTPFNGIDISWWYWPTTS